MRIDRLAWIYALAARSRAWLEDARRHLSGLIVVSAIVGTWFWWAEQQYADALPTFLGDQITEKLEVTPEKVIARLFGFLLNFLGLFSLPWLAAILYAKDSRTFANSQNEERVLHFRLFVLGWFLLCALLFSFGKLYTLRYLLPVRQLFSIVLADALGEGETRAVYRITVRGQPGAFSDARQSGYPSRSIGRKHIPSSAIPPSWFRQPNSVNRKYRGTILSGVILEASEESLNRL